MSTGLSLFNQSGTTLAIPDYLLDLNDEGNIQDRARVPSLTYEGKIWAISTGGEKTQLMRRDADGDELPLATMKVVILDFAQRRGRAFYPGAYDPAKAAQPECWSDDGVAPDASVREPKATACDKCPLAIKGSKMTEQGKAVAACTQHRMLAVTPAFRIEQGAQALRLKLAVTSDYDKENPHETTGWFSFRQYQDMLASRGVKHTAMLVTKMKFDPAAAYPKVLFSPDRWVTPEERAVLVPLAKAPETTELLGRSFTPAGVNGTRVTAAADEDAPSMASIAAKAQAAAEAKARAEAEAAAAAAAAKAAKAAKAKAAAEAAAKAEAEAAARARPAPGGMTMIMDDDDEVPSNARVVSAPTTVPRGSDEPVAAIEGVPDDVVTLLNDWDKD